MKDIKSPHQTVKPETTLVYKAPKSTDNPSLRFYERPSKKISFSE
jgi:hypothetical protein